MESMIFCPGCGRKVMVKTQAIEISTVEQTSGDKRYSDLRNIAEQVGVSVESLLTEAREIAPTLAESLPILERKYNICIFCGNRQE